MSHYYTTENGSESGRASFMYKTEESAQTKCRVQNDKAEAMGIKARYTVAEFDGEPNPKEVRT